ncbi:cell surface protein SprA [bacterium]|nr:cell surface protein SprA [bacterium]RQV93304.1 MAG: cell surface protein SprA [bacterium]
MFFLKLSRSESVRSVTTFSIFFFLSFYSVQAEVGLRLPQPRSSLAPIVYKQQTSVASVCDILSYKIINYPRSFSHSISIDSSGKWVTITHRAYNRDIRIPRRLTLENYLSERSHIENLTLWKEYVLLSLSGSRYQTQGGGGITIESPEIRSRTFRQIFGGETLSLNVTGRITIDGNMRNEKRSQVKTAFNRAPNTSFTMKQTQQFTVEGKIGENVSILVDQDSERPFEFENAFRLEYSSDEDGILKSLRAGNISLSLPSTQFVTFSAQNSGLFGIKSEFKIGRLDITAIASIEKGEKKKLSLTGGKQEESFQIQDYQYRRYTYFFLDSTYRTNYMNINENGIHFYDLDNYITDINVYMSGNVNDEIQGYAVLDPMHPDTSLQAKSDLSCYPGHFVRLDPSEYYLSRELGFIALNTPVQENTVLAVAYRDSSGNVYGSLPADVNVTDNIFKLIKPENSRPTDETWDLEWKNVYYLGGRDIEQEGFDLKIYYKSPSGIDSTSTEINGEPKGYLNIFGLDNYNEDGKAIPNDIIDIDPNILSLSRGELIFPHLRPFAPEEGEQNVKLPEDKRAETIYTETVQSNIIKESKFYLMVNSSRRSTNYSLGFNVIEGTEEVFLNGRRLQSGSDYTINYMTGQLVLLNEEASNPDANIEINYESQRMFAVDKKTLMGARAEYTLWEESSQRSFIGATLLYLDQNTLDRRIRVGRESPMQNIVWGANAAFQFKPDFMTRALDYLPLLEAEAPSNFSLEAEIAQVLPNPNTLNSEATDDPDGVAYLDDFESSKRETPLGINYGGWRLSSPPTTHPDSAKNDYMYSKGRLIWYSPYGGVPIQHIWPDREVTTNFGGSTTQNVLTLQFSPNDTLDDKKNSWGGIQKALSSGYADQTDSRFLELWIQGNSGCLHVDLGQVSEDAIPNQSLNTEDKKVDGYYYNNILDEGEDTGIDGVFGDDPTDSYFHPHEKADIVNGEASPYDFWDINNNGTKEPNEPWSYDDWQYESRSTDYTQINGTEKNEKAFETRYPDTEDINGNGNVDLTNDYFEYSFHIDPSSPYIAGGHNEHGGWWLYRIPLNEPTKIVGNPDWSRIKHVRLWINGVDESTAITFAEINLVGNEWKLLGVMTEGDSTYQLIEDSTMTMTVINTHDNPGYVSPPGVEGVIDPIQQIRSKEQSLVIKVNNLSPGATATAQKQFYEPENLINYRTLKMYVHGGDHTHILTSDSVEFFLQLGSDTKNEHYYEVRFLVQNGWNLEKNSIEVDFETLSRLKLEMQSTGKESISEIQPNGHTITIRGNPSLTNTRWLIAGIKNHGPDPLTDEIWLDELRISNVRKDKGVAMRVSGNIALSDFMLMNGNYTRKDADFHTVNEQFGGGSNTYGGNINTSVQLHKLLPTQWGLSIPLTANYAKSIQTPKFKPGSDVLVNKNTTPDSILIKEIQTRSETMSMNISFRKQTQSRNFWTRYLIDPISGSLNYKETNNKNPQTLYSKNTAYGGSFAYNLSFSGQNYWEPFKWMGQNGILKRIAQMKFYYLPSRISLQMNGSESENDTKSLVGIGEPVNKASVTRTFSTELKPFNALSFSYTNGLISNMKHARWVDIVRSLEPGEATSKTQNISTDFRPAFFSWLTHNFRYSSNYQWTDNPEIINRGTGTNARVSTSFNINGQFNPRRLIQALRKQPSSQNPTPRQPVIRSQTDEEEGDDDNQEEEAGEKKPFPLFSLFSLLGKAIEKMDAISITFTESKSANHYGILGTPTFAYQIGTTLDPGVTFSENVTQRPSTTKNRTISLRTNLNITSRLSTSLDYNFTDSENQSTQTTGSIKKSAFLLKDKVIPLPNWSVTWRGLEKFPLFSHLARSVSLSHTFDGTTTQYWNETRNDTTRVITSKDFRPLLGLSFTFLNGMTANLQYTKTETIEREKKYGQRRTKKIGTSITVTVKYSKRGGFNIPFLGSTKLDNNIDFSLSYTRRSDSQLQSLTETSAYTEITKSKNWSLQPRITYTFSRTVQGGAYFEIGEREDKITGITTIKAFGLNAVISLMGN